MDRSSILEILEGILTKRRKKKVYKQEFLEAPSWPLLVLMLEAAYQFTQKNEILKKMSLCLK